MSQNIITLADLLENVELGGGSVITSITELEPAAGPCIRGTRQVRRRLQVRIRLRKPLHRG